MRITGGKARGIVLKVPKNVEIRPSTDVNRQRIFNRIGAGIQNAVVWDCFAGTGAFGLEAISRGAKEAIFFEKNPKTVVHLKQNAVSVCKSACLEVEHCVKIITTDIFGMSFAVFKQPNFIFFDPPYRFWSEQPDALHATFTNLGTFCPNAVLVLGFPSQVAWSTRFLWQPLRPLKVPRKINDPQIELFRTINGIKAKADGIETDNKV